MWGILQPDQITSFFNDNLFMPSVWKKRILDYWG